MLEDRVMVLTDHHHRSQDLMCPEPFFGHGCVRPNHADSVGSAFSVEYI